ncbi:MAG: uracil-DNA glycosylase family protein [Anaerolineales bacterium]|nr:uracil-DNA glycosylase family protein [Anaerolineales bacterium]
MTDSQRAAALAELHAQLRACRKCLEAGYRITPGPVVHGVHTAKVMTIGQAPGVTEVEAKRPFNGDAGRRLFQWLAEAGFDEAEFRATQAMLAVTRCYPGKSPTGHGDRLPTREEQALCRPWLEHEIELINPRLIIPIGKLAIGLFFDPLPALEDVIGTQIERDGRVIIPLPHPSGASTWPNRPDNAARIKRALKLIDRQRRMLGL